ncbi:MAG: hypothetical protein ACPGVU_19165, partial [Limisphaerales bacterium]
MGSGSRTLSECLAVQL